MIFTELSSLDFEYNADSARRLFKIPINPLNFSQHLKLKYNFSMKNISAEIANLIFDNKRENIIDLEKKINNSYLAITDYNSNEWDEFLQYGGFPSSFYQNNNITYKKLLDTINRVISVDMNSISNISPDSQTLASRLLYFFSLQNPGEISRNAMSNYLDCHLNTVNNIIEILEKTHLIFHVEPYSSSPKRGTKSFKYFFATQSLRHALSINLGIASNNPKAYMGILLENLVASSFFNLKNKSDVLYSFLPN